MRLCVTDLSILILAIVRAGLRPATNKVGEKPKITANLILDPPHHLVLYFIVPGLEFSFISIITRSKMHQSGGLLQDHEECMPAISGHGHVIAVTAKPLGKSFLILPTPVLIPYCTNNSAASLQTHHFLKIPNDRLHRSSDNITP